MDPGLDFALIDQENLSSYVPMRAAGLTHSAKLTLYHVGDTQSAKHSRTIRQPNITYQNLTPFFHTEWLCHA
jgi:hypothetical protein